MGVAGRMQALIKQFGLERDEAEELEQIAYLHNIGYSIRVKNRSLHALDSALFALEKGLGEDIALAVMFHTKADGEAHFIGKKIAKLYHNAKKLVDDNEKVRRYIDYITYCDLHTEADGRPTQVNRRIFKILARYEKNSAVHKNIKHHKAYFLKLDKKIRESVIKEKGMFDGFLSILSGEE